MRVCLYGLDNPVLIVKQKTSIIYYNQVAGVACFPEEQEGFLIPLPDMGKARIFNSDWWYATNNRTDLRQSPPKWDWVVPKGQKTLSAYFGSDGMEYGERFTDLKKEIEEEINSKTEFKIKVKTKTIQYEAWIEVTLNWKENGKTKRISGILTWQNCD